MTARLRHLDTVRRDRLEDVVRQQVGGELRQAHLTEENDTEFVYLVMWRSGREWGTHRLCLAKEGDDAMLVWGHYFPGPNGAVQVNKDFAQRVAEGT